VPSDGGGGSTSTGPSDTSSNAGTNAGTDAGTTTTTGDWTGADSGSSGVHPKFDIGVDPLPDGCPPQPRPPEEVCTAELPPDAFFLFYCVELAEGETCEAWARGFEETPCRRPVRRTVAET